MNTGRWALVVLVAFYTAALILASAEAGWLN